LGESGFLERAIKWVYGRLNASESVLITSFLYLAFTVVVMGFIFRDTSFLSRVYPKLSMVSPGRFLGLDKSQDFVLAMATLLVLLTVSATVSFGKYRTESSKRHAIVVEEEVHVDPGCDQRSDTKRLVKPSYALGFDSPAEDFGGNQQAPDRRPGEQQEGNDPRAANRHPLNTHLGAPLMPPFPTGILKPPLA